MDKGLDLIDIPKDERFPKNLVQTACKSVKGVILGYTFQSGRERDRKRGTRH